MYRANDELNHSPHDTRAIYLMKSGRDDPFLQLVQGFDADVIWLLLTFAFSLNFRVRLDPSPY
jgi:hypothetical protein